MVLVTHHVEEIPPGFSHALLLRQGGVVAQGLIGDTITGDNLSTTFGVPLMVSHDEGRFTARSGLSRFPAAGCLGARSIESMSVIRISS